ncbi:uncharacterized protein LOC120659575 [Panicum virgatum]|uniref:F-box domain-containing protein n=1 Tax=Panicum virgatum TaxID=38727 RepID=A0A8T0VFW4_PANVG|nr:uncharacterized protein LOC120659575 [Panicum virgatum]KAG2632194.1 hypothetical protein PVAP13_2NG068700 [Panicum virgatum]
MNENDQYHRSKLSAAAAAPGARVPDDALVEMFELLPAKHLHRCKCVSKAWCGLVTDPLHRERYAQTLAGFLHADVVVATAAEGEIGGGVCESCSEGDGAGAAEESSLRMCRHVMLSKRRITRRFINVSGMAEPLIDAAFSFLPPPPAGDGAGFRDVILDARDGLVLLARVRRHEAADLHPPACYLVCNPATARWASVPASGWAPAASQQMTRTFLLFDAAASPHAFHLLQFWLDEMDAVRAVHTYSSAGGAWTDRVIPWLDGGWRDWGRAMALIQPGTGAAVAGGMLHLVVDTDGTTGPNNLVAVDEEGSTRQTIPLPRRKVAEKDWHSVFVARSQERLHYVMCVRPPHGRLSEEHPLKLLVWVLEDHDSGEWVLKHTVSFPELFGRIACQFRVEYSVVAVHPDGNGLFFVRHWDRKLVAYDMDRREVLFVANLGAGGELGDELPTPYVPLYSESSALTNKQ